jgi:hypothetical protein
MRRLLLVTTALLFLGASGQADATTLRAAHARHVGGAPTKHVASRLPKGSFIDPDTGAVCQNTGWASICDGGVAGEADGPSATDSVAQEQAQQESQDATDITNAGIAQTVQGINGP